MYKGHRFWQLTPKLFSLILYDVFIFASARYSAVHFPRPRCDRCSHWDGEPSVLAVSTSLAVFPGNALDMQRPVPGHTRPSRLGVSTGQIKSDRSGAQACNPSAHFPLRPRTPSPCHRSHQVAPPSGPERESHLSRSRHFDQATVTYARTSTMMTTLSSPPQDILLVIFRDLDLFDVIRVGMVSPQSVALPCSELLYTGVLIQVVTTLWSFS